MDYKGLIQLELDKLIEENKDFTMGEIFYSFLRPCFLNGKILLDASDEDIFNSLERARKVEGTDTEMTDQEIQAFING